MLYEALLQRPRFSIGTDVLPEEPPNDHPLLEAWRNDAPWLEAWRNDALWLGGRFLLTPHSAFYSEDAGRDLRRSSAEIAKRVLEGGAPYNLVNP